LTRAARDAVRRRAATRMRYSRASVTTTYKSGRFLWERPLLYIETLQLIYMPPAAGGNDFPRTPSSGLHILNVEAL
jgi:hypothetical protein